jgi:(heptosyl)LPS beta-1,4-glucosyltransferase
MHESLPSFAAHLSGERRTLLTVVIPTLNEADRLPDCLASVAWASEIIVVDAGSADETVTVARKAGALVISMRGGTIGEQKNAGIAAASTRWILSIDADERVTPALRASIEEAVRTPTAEAYRLHLRNHYLGAVYMRGSWGRDRHVRLYPSTCRWSAHQVHEKLEGVGTVQDLSGFLEHESYRDLSHQLRKAVTYAEWGAADLQTTNRRITVATLVGRPLWRFLKTYLLQGMWRDGTRGFVFCAVHAWACFSKYAVVWDQQRQRALGLPLERVVAEPPTVPAAAPAAAAPATAPSAVSVSSAA